MRDRGWAVLGVWLWSACGPDVAAGMPTATTDADTTSTISSDDRGADTTGSESTTTEMLDESSSSTSAGGSSTGGPICGDGALDPDEACDDGNEVDGDGCNRDCIVSGTLLWTVTHDGPANTNDRAAAVAIADNGTIVAAGMQWADAAEDVWMARYYGDGVQIWTSDDGDGLGSAAKVAIDDAGDIVVCGAGTFAATSAWVRKYDGNGTRAWEVIRPNQGDGVDCRALAITDDDAVIVGGREYVGVYQGWIARIEADGSEGWSELVLYSQYAWPDDLIVTVDGGVLAAGHEYDGVGGNTNWLARWEVDAPGTTWDQHIATEQHMSIFADDPSDAILLIRRAIWSDAVDWAWHDADGAARPGLDYPVEPESMLIDAAFDGAGNTAIVGWIPKAADFDAWLGKYAPDGTLLWSAIHDAGGPLTDTPNDTYTAVAIGPDDAIVVVGGETVAGEGQNILVQKYAP
jgi:cysteine-rich repeat protein